MRAAFLLALLLAGFSADRAFAVGLGGYLSVGGGKADWTYDFDVAGDVDADGDTGRAGLGFVMEIHPAGPSLFNYRLGVGYEAFGADFDFDNGPSDELELVGLVMDHTFGFALMRHDVARLWIGPQVRIGLYGGGFDDLPGDVFAAEFGIGGAFGANFHVGDAFTISTVAGIRVSGYGASNDDNGVAEGDITGAGGSAFLNLAFMARTGSDRK
ncbi:MAG TPA: hypothetical protein VGK94_13190 [Candidatus Polarisedimenticolia bacterium]